MFSGLLDLKPFKAITCSKDLQCLMTSNSDGSKKFLEIFKAAWVVSK